MKVNVPWGGGQEKQKTLQFLKEASTKLESFIYARASTCECFKMHLWISNTKYNLHVYVDHTCTYPCLLV